MTPSSKRIAPRAIATPLALTLALVLAGCPTPTGVGALDIPADALKLSAKSTLKVGDHPHGIVLAGGILVNANTASGTLSLIDPASDTVVKTLELPGGKDHASPNTPMTTPDGRYAIALDTKANVLRIVKGETQDVVRSVTLTAKPGNLAWADATTAYVSLLPSSGQHTMMEGHAANVVKVTWPSGFEADAVTETLNVNREGVHDFTAGTLAAGGGYLAVANKADNSVSFVALGDPHAVTTLKEGNGPAAIAISAHDGGATLVVAHATSNTVTLYDLKAKAALKTFQVGSTPSDMVLRGDGRYAYVTSKGAGEVAVVDLAEKRLHAQLKVGRNLPDRPSQPMHAFAVTKPETSGDPAIAQQIWVGGDGDDSVTVVDAEAQKVVAVITVGKGMHKAAFTAGKAYVSNMMDGTVSVIDRSVIR